MGALSMPFILNLLKGSQGFDRLSPNRGRW